MYKSKCVSLPVKQPFRLCTLDQKEPKNQGFAEVPGKATPSDSSAIQRHENLFFHRNFSTDAADRLVGAGAGIVLLSSGLFSDRTSTRPEITRTPV